MTPELEARLRCLAELAVASERRAHITELAQDPAIERGKVLRATAAILTTNVRRDDAVARDGGEEFLRVFPATDRDIARPVCEGIVTAFRTTRHELGPQPESVAVSIDYARRMAAVSACRTQRRCARRPTGRYTERLQGRNRTVRYAGGERAPVVQFLRASRRTATTTPVERDITSRVRGAVRARTVSDPR